MKAFIKQQIAAKKGIESKIEFFMDSAKLEQLEKAGKPAKKLLRKLARKHFKKYNIDKAKEAIRTDADAISAIYPECIVFKRDNKYDVEYTNLLDRALRDSTRALIMTKDIISKIDLETGTRTVMDITPNSLYKIDKRLLFFTIDELDYVFEDRKESIAFMRDLSNYEKKSFFPSPYEFLNRHKSYDQRH